MESEQERAVSVCRLEVEVLPSRRDPVAQTLIRRFESWQALRLRDLRVRHVYWIEGLDGLDDAARAKLLEAVVDPIEQHGAVGMLADPQDGDWAGLQVQYRPGVTDCVGATLARLVQSLFPDHPGPVRAYFGAVYWAQGVQAQDFAAVAGKVIYNPLIELATPIQAGRALDLQVPSHADPCTPAVQSVPMVTASDERLVELSKTGMLALSLEEMRAIAQHFKALGREPSDAELECLAQTWSEHCKHKIFASPIEVTQASGQTELIEAGLFSTYIKQATKTVQKARLSQGVDPQDASFLVSVFHDNAGVVRFSDTHHLAYKVETHNSPSALDPYGGAMTGIVGVNRDSYGTGRGAELLTNVWGFCLGPPEFESEDMLPAGLMHPRRIRDGVHAGVVDGGNHSGIPYSRGFELFDERYVGKPLVYCGTVSLMPVQSAGTPTHEKHLRPGDRVVMVGGRIGKDGIHGATFSSLQLDETAPVQAVQIGDPITQKMMWDMLSVARERGLYSGFTDNGAGGLSSSVGEMAELTGGATIDLAKAPCKYPGLAPWEILVSEAQERMTVAVPPQHLQAFLELARAMEVEASDLGEFTDTGRFVVTHHDQRVCDLELEFLHEGVPLPVRKAAWVPPQGGPCGPDARGQSDLSRIAQDLLALLATPNLRSNELWARRYDHEVKGLSAVKPWVGAKQNIPSPATVMRALHHERHAVVLGEGVHPWYSDVDPYWMAVAGVDEALRRVLCAGADLQRVCALDNFCWPDPILSEQTPDGPHKLGQLVKACQGLHDACVAYGMPLVSGKDSMKNDAFFQGRKISIPPTLLVSAMGQMPDVRRAKSLDTAQSGDLLYVLGQDRGQLAGSQWALLHKLEGTDAPSCDLSVQYKLYQTLADSLEKGQITGMQICARGGLSLACAQLVLAHEDLRLDLWLDKVPCADKTTLSPTELAFSESLGRILLIVDPQHESAIEAAFAGQACAKIGRFEGAAQGAALVLHHGQAPHEIKAQAMLSAYQGDAS